MEERTLKEEIRDLKEIMGEKQPEKKPKRFRGYMRTALGKRKIKRGYLLVFEISENRSVKISKIQIIDGTVKLPDDTGGTYHAISSLDIYFYQPILGKNVPVIFQPKSKLNPWNPNKDLDINGGENQTYGQKYVMAKIESDKITEKKKFSGVGWILAGAVVIGVIYLIATGGF